jgi:hypothetical protein
LPTDAAAFGVPPPQRIIGPYLFEEFQGALDPEAGLTQIDFACLVTAEQGASE